METFLYTYPLVLFSFHALASRLPFLKIVARQRLAIFVIISVAFIFFALSIFLSQNTTFLFSLFYFITYFGIGHIYFHIFNMSETARRIRLLLSLDSVGGSKLLNEYSDSEVLNIRLGRLVNTKKIILVEENYMVVDTFFLKICTLMNAYRQFIFNGITP